MAAPPPESYRLSIGNIRHTFAWVEIEGKPVRVYGQEPYSDEAGTKTTSGFIEAEEGQTFVVKAADLRQQRPAMDYQLEMSTDGTTRSTVVVARDFALFDAPSTSEDRFFTFEGVMVSATEERPFVFNNLSTTEDEDAASADESRGVIAVSYYPSVIEEEPTEQPTGGEPDNLDPLFEDHKQCGVTMQVGFGEKVEVAATTYYRLVNPVLGEAPQACADFIYVSRAFLQAEGFIPYAHGPSPSPQPPSPAPSASPSPSSDTKPRLSSSPPVSPNPEPCTSRLEALRAERRALQREKRLEELEKEIRLEEDKCGKRRGSETADGAQSRLDGSSGLKKVKKEGRADKGKGKSYKEKWVGTELDLTEE